jgi:hypothetical protein
MTLIVAAWLGSGVGVAPACCDLVEINHYLDSAGCENFCQIIAWDWDPQYQRFHAQQWAVVIEWDRVGKTTTATDYQSVEVEIRSEFFRETWTRFDPEMENRKLFDSKYRRQVW